MKGFNASDYETEQVFVESKDGTKVPVFIIHKKVPTKTNNFLYILFFYFLIGWLVGIFWI